MPLSYGSLSPAAVPAVTSAATSGPSKACPASTTPPPNNRVLYATIALSVLAYYLLARALGLSLPDLTEPWRSILRGTFAAAAIFVVGAAMARQLAPTPAQASRHASVLLAVSLVGWAVVLVLVIRESQEHDELALLFACFAAVLVPVPAAAFGFGKPSPPALVDAVVGF